MIVMVCLDDRNGMMFNHRRQSQDRVLRGEMLAQAGDRPLLVTPYTARQFSAEDQTRLRILEDPLAAAGPGEPPGARGRSAPPGRPDRSRSSRP